MAEHVTIASRFNGPPTSAHGGYACGLVAERVDAPVASVSLRRPPPLERPLDVSYDDDRVVRLRDDAELVAEGEPASLSLNVPEPVSVAVAGDASTASVWADMHPFPTCFGCGPQRDPSEALHLVLGPVAGRQVFADTWVPDREFADAHGAVSRLFVWAALDCPTAVGAFDPGGAPRVLARLTADPGLAPIVAGEPHVVIAWRIDSDERKARGGSAIFTASGQLCAVAEGLWIALRDG
jgi:hypothetical protein